MVRDHVAQPGVGADDRAERPQNRVPVEPAAAESRRNERGQQAGCAQRRDLLERRAAVGVGTGRVGREALGQRLGRVQRGLLGGDHGGGVFVGHGFGSGRVRWVKIVHYHYAVLRGQGTARVPSEALVSFL